MSKQHAATSWPRQPFRAKNLLTPLPATLAAFGLLLALPGGVPFAQAATSTVATAPPIADQDAATADLVQRLVLDRAASLARVQRKADDREQQLLDQLESKDRTLRRALKEAQAGGRQTAQLRADLAGVMAERTRLVDELTRRDTVFKGELAEYRRLVAELANSPNPERRQALERYADGDRVGAFATLKELTRIEEAAGEKAVKLRAAARYREQAALAADMKDRGDPGVTTLTVLAEWEAAAGRDPGDFVTWIYMTRLRQEAGQTRAAIEAVLRAKAVAGSDRERAWAAADLGDLQVVAGDLHSAQRSFQESLGVAQRLAASNPSSIQAQRDVSVSLHKLCDAQLAAGDLLGANRSCEASLGLARRLAAADSTSTQTQRDVAVSLQRLGNVVMDAKDLSSARSRFEESLQILQRLAVVNLTSTQAQRDVSVGFNKLGDVLKAAGDLFGAQRRFEESLEIARRLAAADPFSAQAQRDVSVSLGRIGDALKEAGDLPGAQRRFEESLEIDQRLAEANPTSIEAQRDVSLSLNRLGDLLMATGNLLGARRRVEECLQIQQRLATANPTSVQAQRDVFVSMWRLAVMKAGVKWKDVAVAMQEMKERNLLLPMDEQFLVEAKALATKEE